MDTKGIREPRFLCLYIFIFFLSAFVLFSNGHFGGDGMENYLTAESIVLDGDIAIHDRPFEISELRYTIRGLADISGRRYSAYGIGMPLLLIPFYGFGHILSKFIPFLGHDYLTQFCVSMANPLITALIASALFAFVRRLGYCVKTAISTVFCYGFCTMSWIYTRSGFSEPAITLFLFLAGLSLYTYEERKLLRYVSLSGFLIACSVLIKINSIVYLPVVFLYLIHKSFKAKRSGLRLGLWFAFMVPVFLFVPVYLYHSSIIGSCTAGGGSDLLNILKEQGSLYGRNIGKGLFYYLLSPGKGYFFYNIPLILALMGTRRLIEKRRGLSLYIIYFVMTNLIFHSYIFMRGSLFSWGPRYLYPTIPFMCIFLAEFIENAKNRLSRVLLIFMSSLGFLIQLPSAFINTARYLFFVKERLGIDEYLINFMPELSPIMGSWFLFASALRRLLSGASLHFFYNPDFWFFKPVTATLQGYDVLDIWWANALKVSQGLLPIVIIAVLVIVTVAVITFAKIKQAYADSIYNA